MERICPLGRIVAEPPPLSDTCLPGAGRIEGLVTLPFPPFPVLPPPGLPDGAPLPMLPAGPLVFLPTVEFPGLPVLAVPVLPMPGRAPGVVPALEPVVLGRVPVEGRVLEDRDGALLWGALFGALACGALAWGALGLGAGGAFF